MSINIEMLNEKMIEVKKSKKEEVTKELEKLASTIKSKDSLEDFQIKNILQSLLDYRKACISLEAISAITTEDEMERMNLIVQLI